MAQKPTSKSEYRSAWLEVIKAWLPVLTVVVGALWGLYQYNQAQKNLEKAGRAQLEKDGTTRRIEAQKPFLELQFKTYLRINSLVAKLLLFKTESPEYRSVRAEFENLYWAELALVVDEASLKAVNELRGALRKDENASDSNTKLDVQAAALELTLAIRQSIRSGWYGVPPIERG